MTQTRLHVDRKNNRITFRTDKGFGLLAAAASITDSSGASRPAPDGAVRNGLLHEFHLKQLPAGAVEFWQTVQNQRSDVLAISRIVMLDGGLELQGSGWRVAHTELFKKEAYFDGLTKYRGGLFAELPGTEGEFGLSEDFPFPGIFFTHPERGTVLMAVLSQERCKPHWSIRGKGNAMRIAVSERFAGIPAIPVRPGATFSGEHWILLAVHGSLEDAVDEYFALLRKRMPFAGTHSILREAAVWGSWNYNRRPRGHMDITHDSIVANARALPALATDKPRFVMIDDGYQRGSSDDSPKDWFASCLEVLRVDGKTPHDPKRFPRGMKATADAIREAGCEPAIWTTPRVRRQSSFAREQPELFLHVAGRDSFGGRTAYLDYSLPEARAYTRAAWHTLCSEWGYKGIKLDFWSLPFEIPDVMYTNTDRTAIELRNLFLQDLRDVIPAGGYIISGVVINSGNPFVGRYIDAARAGTDIGNGTARDVRESASFLTVASPFYRHDCLLADADTIGWNADVSAGENRLWATAAFLSGAVCEIGGDLTDLTAEARELLTNVVACAGPAKRTVNDLSRPGIGHLPADHMVLEREDTVFEAYLNWARYPREIELKQNATDIWTGAGIHGKYRINPYDAVLFKR